MLVFVADERFYACFNKHKSLKNEALNVQVLIKPMLIFLVQINYSVMFLTGEKNLYTKTYNESPCLTKYVMKVVLR